MPKNSLAPFTSNVLTTMEQLDSLDPQLLVKIHAHGARRGLEQYLMMASGASQIRIEGIDSAVVRIWVGELCETIVFAQGTPTEVIAVLLSEGRPFG
jgi:hypothetical protein